MKIPVFALLATAAAAHGATFAHVKLYTCHIVGGQVQPYTPKVGEPYQAAVEFDQTGSYSGTYHVKFTMAGQDATIDVKNSGSGHAVWVTGEFDLALDDKIPLKVEIDPEGHAGRGAGPTKTIDFTPTPPNAINEFYEPVTVGGFEQATISTSGDGINMSFLMGKPMTASWEKVLSAKCDLNLLIGDHNVGTSETTGPFHYPVYYATANNMRGQNIKFTQTFSLEVRNERVNPDKLRHISWSDLAALQNQPLMKYFTQPEDVIQSNDPVIAKFVEDALGGPGYKSRFTPYDAARKCFMHVLHRVTYFYPHGNEEDQRAHDAVELVKTGVGDCGSFSMLLVACYRHLGIPARTACGAWVGKDGWHCWSEMFFPTAGWIISDGSAGNSMSENGDYAYYFGYIPDLNDRFSVMRGNTFNVGSMSADWLQLPTWDISGGSITTDDTHIETHVAATAHRAVSPWDKHGKTRPTMAPARRKRRS